MSSALVIGLGVVVVSAAFVIPALFAWHPEPATSPPDSPRAGSRRARSRRAPADQVTVPWTRRVASGIGLLALVLGSALALAAVLGAAVLVVGLALK